MENHITTNQAEYLKNHGIKPSYQRMKIFDYLVMNKTHPTVDEIYKALLPELPTLSKTTIYNTLGLFIEKKVAKVITIDENETRYDADISVHGHFKCNHCERIYDFEADVSKSIFPNLDGFVIEEKHLYLKGVCKTCNTN